MKRREREKESSKLSINIIYRKRSRICKILREMKVLNQTTARGIISSPTSLVALKRLAFNQQCV